MPSYETGAHGASDTQGGRPAGLGSVAPSRADEKGTDPLLGESQTPLSKQTKFCFALGALPNALTVCITGFFLNPFLLEVAGVSASFVSLVLLLGRAWDAVTTAAAGGLVSRSRGGLRKWLLIGIVPTCVTYFLLWVVFDGFSSSGKAAFVVAMYLGYQLFSSLYQVPYTAMTVRLHASPEERDKATAWRVLVELLSILIGAGGQSFILAGYNANDECVSCDLGWGDSAAQKAYLVSAIVMTSIFGVGGLMCFFFVRERIFPVVDDTPESEESSPTCMDGVRAAFKSRAFLTLTGAFLLIGVAIAAVQGNMLLYSKYAVPAYADQFQYLLIVLVLSSTLGMPLWAMVMKKIGKRNTYIIGGAGWAPLLHILFYIPMMNDPPLYLGVIGFAGGGLFLAAVFLLPWAMLPNVIDMVELETGQRHETVFYAFFVFFLKMGAGLALAGSAFVLDLAGWKDEPCCIATDEFAYCDCSNEISCNCDVQPDSVGDALKYIVGIACPLMVLVGVFLSWLYPITPEKEIEVMAGLEARRGGSQVFGSASVRASLRLSVPVPSITQRVSRRSLPADLSKGGTEALRERADSLPHPIRV
eukprot:Hpha_TRINITY_DN7989_c0_g1::TRINITY_DN7989_c0_g1_i3::g.145994::m.145994